MARLLLFVLVLLVAGCGAAPAEVASAPPGPETTAPAVDPDPTRDPTTEPADHHDHHGDASGDAPPAPAEDTLPSAAELIERTAEALEQWRDPAVAEAAGFRSIGDGFTGWEHLVNREWAADGTILDPERPESLVYRVEGGERELVSAMYMLPPGTGMEDVPVLDDERAVWHLHDDLCFDEEDRLAGILHDGRCVPGGTHRVTAPMMHVWIVDHPCGAFAAIEGHGDVCDAAHDH